MIFYGLWNEQQITAVLIMDLSAAFIDTVNHDLLLDVLQEKFGITNTALKWYKNYLKAGKFKVCINGSHSSEQIRDCWYTPRINTRCIPIYLLCLNTV